MDTIKLSVVLADMDEKKLPDGSLKVFSIKFVKQNGELVFVNRAIRTGLNMDMKKNAFRGILRVDKELESLGHPTPVKIWNIIEYNGIKVSL